MLTRRAFVGSLALAPSARAQERFPARPVKIINSLAAGSATDVRARVIAGELTKIWGQQAIVENRPGGGGALSVQAVLAALPDGHTLLAAPGSIFSLLPAQGENLSFDVNRDLVPIGLTSVEPMIVAVSAKLPVTTLAELVALAKSKPQEIVIGTNAAGSFPHLTAGLLTERTGAPFTILPYATGGAVEAVKDIVAGRVHVIIEARTGILGHLDAGELKPIVVMNDERMKALPDTPATIETTRGLRAVGWSGLAAPRGTPGAVIEKLVNDLRTVLSDRDVVERIDRIGTPFRPLYGSDFARFIAEEQAQWHPVMRAFNAAQK